MVRAGDCRHRAGQGRVPLGLWPGGRDGFAWFYLGHGAVGWRWDCRRSLDLHGAVSSSRIAMPRPRARARPARWCLCSGRPSRARPPGWTAWTAMARRWTGSAARRRPTRAGSRTGSRGWTGRWPIRWCARLNPRALSKSDRATPPGSWRGRRATPASPAPSPPSIPSRGPTCRSCPGSPCCEWRHRRRGRRSMRIFVPATSWQSIQAMSWCPGPTWTSCFRRPCRRCRTGSSSISTTSSCPTPIPTSGNGAATTNSSALPWCCWAMPTRSSGRATMRRGPCLKRWRPRPPDPCRWARAPSRPAFGW